VSKAHIYARNLGANWLGHGANFAVAFFMSPFVVHSLANAIFGILMPRMSLIGYVTVFDPGLCDYTMRH